MSKFLVTEAAQLFAHSGHICIENAMMTLMFYEDITCVQRDHYILFSCGDNGLNCGCSSGHRE